MPVLKCQRLQDKCSLETSFYQDGFIYLFICCCFTMGAYLDKSVCRVMCVINAGIWVTLQEFINVSFTSPVNWRALAWKKTDELLSLESYHLLSVHVLKECSYDNLTVPLPRVLIHSLDFYVWGLMSVVQFLISSEATVNNVCILRAFNKRESLSCSERASYLLWIINLLLMTTYQPN